MKSPLMTAKEVASIMDCSERYGYLIIKKINDEMEADGFIVRPGRVSRKRFTRGQDWKCRRKEEREMELNEVKTCELMEELREREGVEIVQAEPYQQMDISVEGPAVILIVTD